MQRVISGPLYGVNFLGYKKKVFRVNLYSIIPVETKFVMFWKFTTELDTKSCWESLKFLQIVIHITCLTPIDVAMPVVAVIPISCGVGCMLGSWIEIRAPVSGENMPRYSGCSMNSVRWSPILKEVIKTYVFITLIKVVGLPMIYFDYIDWLHNN